MALFKPAACLCLLALMCQGAAGARYSYAYTSTNQNFTLPELGYPYESLEPAISNQTMVRRSVAPMGAMAGMRPLLPR